MSEMPRILCVDDEENILKAIQRSLRKKFEIRTATSGKEGLEVLRSEEPFQVVVSDMKMPEMNGATFLRHVRQEFPDTVRLLLTGFADLDTVVTAVNEGYIYRFISKPCSAGALLSALEDALHQHHLLTSERVLLEETLKGSIQALTEILAMASPAAFGRATRIRQMACLLAKETELADLWQVEVAAMFCQVGSITLPAETAMKVYQGDTLTDQEKAMVDRMPEMSRSILGNIPRLEPVLDILKYSEKNFDGTGRPADRLAGEEIPMGARILKIAEASEKLQAGGESPGRTLDWLRAQEGIFDPAILAIYERVASREGTFEAVRGVTIHELRTGMVLTEEVRSKTGILLVAAGQEVTVSLLERIQNYNDTTGLSLPMWVMNPEVEAVSEEESPTGFSLEDEPVEVTTP